MVSNLRYRQQAVNKKSSDWKGRVWSSNLFSLLLIVLLVTSVIKVGKEIMLRWEINREISNLQTQLDDLESKKDKMDKLISYLQTDEYIEKQARLELNLSKPGEKQINLLGYAQEEENRIVDNRSNLEKWINYFFD